MEITLKNIKTYPRISEETLAFNATLYVDGKLTAEVNNSGHGGCNEYHPVDIDSRKRLEAAWDHARKVETEFSIEQLDILLDRIIEDFEEDKRFKKLCKTKTMFVDQRGDVYTINRPYCKIVADMIREKYTITEIINERYL